MDSFGCFRFPLYDGRVKAGREIGFARSGWSAEREAGRSGTWGYDPRTLFDNFIGRKRDVDGGVLAGFFGREPGGTERDN